jgi:hypothetical protein
LSAAKTVPGAATTSFVTAGLDPTPCRGRDFRSRSWPAKQLNIGQKIGQISLFCNGSRLLSML